jgi:hypothetical protein
MRYIGYIGISLFLVLLVFSAGCTVNGPLSKPNSTKKTPTVTTTPIPTPVYGNLFISTNPIGASVYLENVYKGMAPINLTNLPNGKYNLTLKLGRYNTIHEVVEIKGQSTSISRGMSEASATMDISVTNASVLDIPPCVWSFIGNLNNTGELKVYKVILTLTMTPARAGYETIQESTKMGDIAPGSNRPFSFGSTVDCGGNYRVEIRWNGVDIKNPDIESDNIAVSGSKTL